MTDNEIGKRNSKIGLVLLLSTGITTLLCWFIFPNVEIFFESAFFWLIIIPLSTLGIVFLKIAELNLGIGKIGTKRAWLGWFLILIGIFFSYPFYVFHHLKIDTSFFESMIFRIVGMPLIALSTVLLNSNIDIRFKKMHIFAKILLFILLFIWIIGGGSIVYWTYFKK